MATLDIAEGWQGMRIVFVLRSFVFSFGENRLGTLLEEFRFIGDTKKRLGVKHAQPLASNVSY